MSHRRVTQPTSTSFMTSSPGSSSRQMVRSTSVHSRTTHKEIYVCSSQLSPWWSEVTALAGYMTDDNDNVIYCNSVMSQPPRHIVLWARWPQNARAPSCSSVGVWHTLLLPFCQVKRMCPHGKCPWRCRLLLQSLLQLVTRGP